MKSLIGHPRHGGRTATLLTDYARLSLPAAPQPGSNTPWGEGGGEAEGVAGMCWVIHDKSCLAPRAASCRGAWAGRGGTGRC